MILAMFTICPWIWGTLEDSVFYEDIHGDGVPSGECHVFLNHRKHTDVIYKCVTGSRKNSA